MIEEMRTGKAYELPKEGMARSKLAAGPTTLEDLVSELSLQHKFIPAESLQGCMLLMCLCVLSIVMYMQKQSNMDDVKQPPCKSMHALSKASRLYFSVIQPICLSGYVLKPAIQEEMADDADGQSATRPDEASSSSQSDSGQSATDRQQAEASTSQVS